MKNKTLMISLAVLLFFLALGFTLYPLIANQYNQRHQSQIHTAYQEQIAQADDAEINAIREKAIGEHPKKDMYVTWRCKDGDSYFWGHYTSNRYEALKDLCQRAEQEIDYLAAIGEIPPLTSQKEKERER